MSCWHCNTWMIICWKCIVFAVRCTQSCTPKVWWTQMDGRMQTDGQPRNIVSHRSYSGRDIIKKNVIEIIKYHRHNVPNQKYCGESTHKLDMQTSINKIVFNRRLRCPHKQTKAPCKGWGYLCNEHWQGRATHMDIFFSVIWYTYGSVILVQGTCMTAPPPPTFYIISAYRTDR